MLTYSAEERLALLLSILGDEIAQGAFGAMDSAQATTLRRLYNEYRADPPSSEEIEYVIGDFLKFFDFAVDAMGLDLGQSAAGDGQTKGTGLAVAEPEVFPEITPSADPIHDLNRLDPYQILKAVETDHPKTIALVLRSIHVKQAAQVMEYLSSATRNQVMNYLTVESTVPGPIVTQVLKTTVSRACAVRSKPLKVEQAKVIADLMRSLSKSLRVELMKQLADTNGKLAEQVKSSLYLFEDILRLSDRDTQKLLSQLDTESMIVGLQRCSPELCDKLLNNLSKRARETISEEMEYKQNVTDPEIEEARAKIVQVIGQLDEAGEIKL